MGLDVLRVAQRIRLDRLTPEQRQAFARRCVAELYRRGLASDRHLRAALQSTDPGVS